MRKYSFFGLVLLISFLVGIFVVVWTYSIKVSEDFSALMSSSFLQPQPVKVHSSIQSDWEELPPPSEDEELLALLKQIIEYKQKKGKQTFYVSLDKTYGYWIEDKAIYVLPVIDEQIHWADGKARIDLEKGIVPSGKYGNLGCCLHEKDWADTVLKKCKKGQKFTLETK